jgi:hypothetical protein
VSWKVCCNGGLEGRLTRQEGGSIEGVVWRSRDTLAENSSRLYTKVDAVLGTVNQARLHGGTCHNNRGYATGYERQDSGGDGQAMRGGYWGLGRAAGGIAALASHGRACKVDLGA